MTSKKLFKKINNETIFKIGDNICILIFKTESSFQKRKNDFLGLDDISDGFYIPDQRIILIPPKTAKDSAFSERIILHEMFHDIVANIIKPRDLSHLSRRLKSYSSEVKEAYSKIGLEIPWLIEERLCDLFSFCLCDYLPVRSRKIRKIARIVMEPIFKGNET